MPQTPDRKQIYITTEAHDELWRYTASLNAHGGKVTMCGVASAAIISEIRRAKAAVQQDGDNPTEA